MDEDQLNQQGKRLAEELERERASVGRHAWRCSEPLRSRIVAYAVACEGDGESHGRIALRLGVAQPTLSRWVREARVQGASLLPVAIVPRTHPRAAASMPPSPLRLVTPGGYVVEGLTLDLVIPLLELLG